MGWPRQKEDLVAEPLIFINTYTVRPGREEEYANEFKQVADLVHAEEPKMLYFAHHMSEDGSIATTVQVHADAANMEYHMQLIEDHVEKAAEYIDFSSMAIQLYGTPTTTMLEQMREIAGSGVAVTVSPAAVAFNRFE